VPERIPRDEIPTARKLLDRDGAVILTGWPVEPDSAVNAASAILGTRLRQLEKIHERTTENTTGTQEAPSSGFLHRDGAYGVVDINDQLVQLRIPDPDYILIFCAAVAPAGGESVVIDGYRLIERLRSSAPELYEFLTTIDVDFTSRNTNPDFPRVPRLCRIVEWTRGGRMILRSAERAQPMPRDPRWDEHDRLIQAWVDVCETLGAQIRQDTTLAPGEVLVVDNYRCLHGVRRNDGRRTTYILRCKSQDAR
ncbi:MAG: TauD/TfdA family dioxygenase, partial [Pseudonocardiaceae bacterium]